MGHSSQGRKKIENGKFNPNRSDKKYIEEILQHYYPDQTLKTFAGNWKTSIGEHHVGLVIAQQETKVSWFNSLCFTLLSSLSPLFQLLHFQVKVVTMRATTVKRTPIRK